jgi:hypothetical protein
MKRIPFLFIILTAVAGILFKLLFIYCDYFVGRFFGEMMPLINTAASVFVGIGLGSIVYSKLSSISKIALYLLFAFSSVTVYMSNYYFDYYFWNQVYAKKANITNQEANSQIEKYLQTKTGTTGFNGYLKYCIAKEPGVPDIEDAEGLLDILVPLMLRLFQWISSLFHVHIAGLIEMIFWYIFSWIWIGIGAVWSENL